MRACKAIKQLLLLSIMLCFQAGALSLKTYYLSALKEGKENVAEVLFDLLDEKDKSKEMKYFEQQFGRQPQPKKCYQFQNEDNDSKIKEVADLVREAKQASGNVQAWEQVAQAAQG